MVTNKKYSGGVLCFFGYSGYSGYRVKSSGVSHAWRKCNHFGRRGDSGAVTAVTHYGKSEKSGYKAVTEFEAKLEGLKKSGYKVVTLYGKHY